MTRDEADIEPLKVIERRAIAEALRATGGRVRRAARLLGISHSTLYRRLQKGSEHRPSQPAIESK